MELNNLNLVGLESSDSSNSAEIQDVNIKDIAVIGVSVKLPDANNLDEYDKNLSSGYESIKKFPEERKKFASQYLSLKNIKKEHIDFNIGGYLNNINSFDYKFFGITPKEASLMDPHQRIFLEQLWKALEDAGYGGESLKNSNTGVYIGYTGNTEVYDYKQVLTDVAYPFMSMAIPGNLSSLLPSRIGYLLNLKGPSLAIDTACSSSLVAVHLACKGLRNGECDLAIAGGVRLTLFPIKNYGRVGIESSDGRTRAFDNTSDGTGLGEGAAALLLKPLHKAIEDGDEVYAVIKGSAINQDGASAGITAPNMLAQEDVMQRAWQDASINPESLSFIEAHGTGTKLGDPIEFKSITNAFKQHTDKTDFCAVSSVKSNLGHLHASAGIAGLVKCILSLKKKKLYPTINYNTLNENINLEESAIYVNNKLRRWKAENEPLRCGINSFGFSGTNCHIVLEEAPAKTEIEQDIIDLPLFVFSATTQENIKQQVLQHYNFLRNNDVDLNSYAYTLLNGRKHMDSRAAFIAHSIEELLDCLKSYLESNSAADGEKENIDEDALITELKKHIEANQSISETIAQKLQHAYLSGNTSWISLFENNTSNKIHIPSYEFEALNCAVQIPDSITNHEFYHQFSAPQNSFNELPEPIVKEVEEVQLKGKDDNNYSDNEKLVAQIWSEVLGYPEINITDNFFKIGGESIALMQIIERIKNSSNVHLSMNQFVQNASVEALANLLANSSSGEGISYPTIATSAEDMYEPFGLTEIQLAYLMGRNESFEMGGIGTHIYSEIETELDIQKFNVALNKVIARHPMLRTIFLPESQQQQILKSVPGYNIVVTDVSKLNADDQQKAIEAKRKSMSHHVFDPNQWPLFELQALKLADNKHLILFGYDMLIADGLSIRIFEKEILHYYANPNISLPSLGINFRDYMLAYEDFKQSDVYKADEKYHLSRLGDLPFGPSLPLVKSPAAIKTPVFDRKHLQFSEESWNKLKNVAGELSITPSALLCTAFAKILNYWSNEDNFSINLTVFNRYPFHADINRIIGDFTSVMLLDVMYDGNTNFAGQAQTIHQKMIDCLSHRHYDGVSLIRELAKQNQTGNKALTPVVFTSMLFEGQPADSDLSLGEFTYGISQTSQVYLDCQIQEINNGLSISWDYNKELFDEQLIETMFTQYTSIVEALINNKSDVKLSLADKDVETIHAYNDTKEAFELDTLHGLFEKQLKETPDATAIVSPDGSKITYSELNEKANQVANYLLAHDVVKEDCVCVMAERRYETIINMLGILKAGGAYVPVEPEYPADRREYIMENSAAKLMLNREIQQQIFSNEKYEGNPKSERAAEDGLAYIIYTSGSTGRPKGVMIDHYAAANTIIDINKKFNITQADKIIGLSSMCFDLSVYDIFGALSTGAALYMVEEIKDTDNHIDLIHKEGITFWNSVPSVMNLMVENLSINSENNSKSFSSLRNVLLSGDWIPVELPERILKYFPQANVTSLGGATEASIWSIYYPVSEVNTEWKSIPYGMPLANQEFYVLRNDLSFCPVGVQGELFIGGDGVASGYMNDVEKTRHAFINHPELGYIYRTGDYGIMHLEGHIEFMGRKDAQVKIRGHRIELGEIESSLAAHPDVRDAVVIVKSFDDNDRKLVAYVTPSYKTNWDFIHTNTVLEETERNIRIPFSEALTVISSAGEIKAQAVDISSNALTVHNKGISINVLEKVKVQLSLNNLTLELEGKYVPINETLATIYWGQNETSDTLNNQLLQLEKESGLISAGEIDGLQYLDEVIKVKLPQGKYFELQNIQFTKEGILLAGVPETIEEGSEAELIFAFKDSKSTLSVKAQTAWTKGKNLGLAFTTADDQTKLALSILTNYSAHTAVNIDHLRSFVSERLTDYMMPFSYTVVNYLPVTANGKINRNALPEPVIETSSSENAAPTNKYEEEVLAMWKEVLKIDSIGIHDNFFELGGDSLQVYQIAMKAEAHFKVKIPVDSLYKEPTVANIADFVQELLAKAGGIAVQSEASNDQIQDTDKMYYWSPAMHWKFSDALVQIGEQHYNKKQLFPEFYFLTSEGISIANLKTKFDNIDANELNTFINDLVKDNVLVDGLYTWHNIYKNLSKLHNNEFDKDILFNKEKYNEYKEIQMNRDFKNSDSKEITLDINHEALPVTITDRMSYRNFNETQVISQKNFSDLLSVFRQYKQNDSYKYYYASSGSLYPIDIYMYIKANRVEGLEEGLYYYNPSNHKVNLLSTEEINEKSAYIKNKEIFRSSAITMYMIFNADASMPVYGGDGYFYASLDAGIMIQVLTHAAEVLDMGLCSIGDMNFDVIKDQFNLTSNQVHLHTIELGLKPEKALNYQEVVDEYERKKDSFE
jgi:amino acid adenylation domain-containing protein